MKKRALIFSIVFTLPILAVAECTQQEAIEAEKTAVTIKSWQELESHFSKYGHCDDGAIAEGYSESISFLMENNWSYFLNYKMEKAFFDFVKKHVDETWEINRFRNVFVLASTNCNISKEPICKAILNVSYNGL